ncbi:MAG: hypothetical protein K2I39_07125, partial [Muribaculaceae bacterium]|nr:hypothetical protein [Muribaculaceae bacterium]
PSTPSAPNSPSTPPPPATSNLKDALEHYRNLIKGFRNEQLISCAFLNDSANPITNLLESSVRALSI